MADYFTLLQEPRRPGLDAEALKAKFHQFSGEVHPDRHHEAPEAEQQAAQARYVELNAAYQCLREPKDRLLHLLTLELGAKPPDIQSIPPDAMELFAEIGQLCRDVDRFLREKAQVTSPLLKVQWFEKGMAWQDRLKAVQDRVAARRDELARRLEHLNAAWECAPSPESPERRAALPLAELEQIYRALSFTTRWLGQLQERNVQLSF
jgi:DnaJ-domain-containing protein 1